METLSLYDKGYIINYLEGDQSLQRTPLIYYISVYDEHYTISEGDTLYTIAFKKYGNSALWYLIPEANASIEDIFDLTVGDTIVIPNLAILKS